MTYEELSIEQQEFINLAKDGKNILVDACIGSGKTTAIQVLCNELPEKKILYLTYNKLLKLDAKNKITNRNVFVQNYNGFAYMCLARQGVRCGLSDQFQKFNQLLPDIPSRYDLLLIDEYQDIESEMVPLLERIKELCPNLQIVAVGDMSQKIYDKTTLNVPEFMNSYLDDFEKISFTRCFRLSSDIAAMFGRIWEKPIIGVNDSCRVAEISESEALHLIKDIEPKDLLCLGARKGSLSKTLNNLESRYSDKFNKTNVYASINEGDRGGVQPESDTAIFTTFDSSKGMERRFCFVFDWDEEYFATRFNQPDAKASILRNIFCVTGSRGKEAIYFVRAPKKHMLSEETLTDAKDKRPDFKKPFNVSDMFDFKYKEDIENCFSILNIRKVNDAEQIIDVPTSDAMIDLSPCLGVFAESNYFSNYDLDDELNLAQTFSDSEAWFRTDNPDDQEKILSLTALHTKYARYITQASLPFINEEHIQLISDRLAEHLVPDEAVQRDCSAIINSRRYGDITINGRCDIERKDSIVELKFVNELQHEHFLQLAMYLCLKNKQNGILWNIKNNEIYYVQKPKTKSFIKTVVNCITKGVVNKCEISEICESKMSNMNQYAKAIDELDITR